MSGLTIREKKEKERREKDEKSKRIENTSTEPEQPPAELRPVGVQTPPPVPSVEDLALSTVIVSPSKKEATMAGGGADAYPEERKSARRSLVFGLPSSNGGINGVQKKRRPVSTPKGSGGPMDRTARGQKSSSPRSRPPTVTATILPPELDLSKAAHRGAHELARSFSMIRDPEVSFPSYEGLVEFDNYMDISQFGMKFISSVNKCISSYDAGVCRIRKRAEEARAEVRSIRRKFDDAEVEHSQRIKLLEKDLSQLKLDHERAANMAVRLEAKSTRQAADLELAKDRLEKSKSLRKTRIQRAFSEGQRASDDKHRALFTEMMGLLDSLSEAKGKELDLAQVVGNLEFIGLLQGKEPPSLEDEKKTLSEWKEEMSGVSGQFDKVIEQFRGKIRSQLVLPTSDVAPTPVDETIEEEAAAIGVSDPNGSNDELPGISDVPPVKASDPESA